MIDGGAEPNECNQIKTKSVVIVLNPNQFSRGRIDGKKRDGTCGWVAAAADAA
jgi:hypothetical protein